MHKKRRGTRRIHTYFVQNREITAGVLYLLDNKSVLCIPITCEDVDMVSILVEALNVESYKTVFPTYFEQSLQQKYARDPESIEMINILMDGRNFDFSVILTNNISGLSTMIREVVNMKTMNFATYYAKSGPAMEKTLDKVMKPYGENAK